MACFVYSAKNANGQVVTGEHEAVSAGSVAAELSSTGMVPLKIEPAPKKKAFWFDQDSTNATKSYS